jgi:5-methylcytosine-specific restriction endonuclease McrA
MNAENTLLLDAVYAPISIIPWTRAITLLWLGKVEVVEEYDRVVRSPSIAVRLPAVVRLVRRIVRGRRRVRLSRQNIYLRDGGKCQYCRHHVSLEDCTFDHVLPRVRGGKTTWTNVVLACAVCNRMRHPLPRLQAAPPEQRPHPVEGLPGLGRILDRHPPARVAGT